MVPTVKPGRYPSLISPSADTSAAPYLVLKVNGRKIFCKGGNWGMDDAMKQVSRARLEPYFKLHRDANFNMVRNWTGESTEEVFYDLCDEYGMLVWNDFWLSTQGYNLEPKDQALFLDNAKDVIVNYRNHPSLAIWCCRNEGYAPAGLENELAGLISREDGTRYYQGNSRYLNLRPSGPWNYFNHPEKYFTDIAWGFNTELGTPSIPNATAIQQMMAKADTWPIGDVWYYHDLHDGQKDYIRAIDSLYGASVNLADFCKKAQMVNYDSHRAMFEAWNSRLWHNTSGLLLWMTHPAWPSTVWQTYSSNYDTFGSFYGAKKACEPIHIQLNPDSSVMVVNTSSIAYSGLIADITVFNIHGQQLFHAEKAMESPANSLADTWIPEGLEIKGVCLIRVNLIDKSKRVIATNEYWKNYGSSDGFQIFNSIEQAKLVLNITKLGKGTCKVSIKNNGKLAAIAINMNLADNKGQPILPAYFSDGYFNLMPGETKNITLSYPYRNDKAIIYLQGYNVDEKFAIH